MSVQNQTVKNVYAGNGSTTVFPFTFALNVNDGDYVGVYVTNDAGISEETDNFTIDTTAKTVTYPATGDPLPEGQRIVIRREIPNEQELNLENLGPFFADDVEGEMDREVMMIQQLQEAVDRSIKVDQASDTKPDELIAELFEASADAVASAAAAKISEDNAALSETAAGNSATAAGNSATAAANSETAAGNSATAAGNSATAAYNSQVAAAASETNAGNSATAANNSKIAAATSETNAGNSATAAGNSATAAGNSATAAYNSQVAAAGSANEAAQSAAEAAGINYLVRKNNTTYTAGVVAFYQTIPSPLVLECTTAGTTAATAPDFSGAAEGDTITDGTVVWTYKSILSGGGVPVGFIMPYAGTGLAEGFLDCDGSAVSRAMYPDLFDAIGTTWGAGDGSTTFNLPRSEDLVLQGASTANPVGTYLSAGLPNIEGTYGSTTYSLNWAGSSEPVTYSGALTGVGSGVRIAGSGLAGWDAPTAISFNASQSNAIYGNSTTVQPPAACVRFMIKYE